MVLEKNACRENESNPNIGKLMRRVLESKALHFGSHDPRRIMTSAKAPAAALW